MNPDADVLWNDGSALAALLGSTSGLDTHKRATSFFRFVCKSLRELAPGSIHDSFGEPSVNHVRDFQVLDGDKLMIADDLLTGVVGEVRAEVGDSLVNSLETIDGFAMIAASLDLASDIPLCVSEVSLCLAGKSWILDRVPVAHGRERL
jgi:hypothetical protein